MFVEITRKQQDEVIDLEEIASRGVDAYQAFGTADLGLIAYETLACDGMTVNKDLILEIGGPVPAIPWSPPWTRHPWIRPAPGRIEQDF